MSKDKVPTQHLLLGHLQKKRDKKFQSLQSINQLWWQPSLRALAIHEIPEMGNFHVRDETSSPTKCFINGASSKSPTKIKLDDPNNRARDTKCFQKPNS